MNLFIDLFHWNLFYKVISMLIHFNLVCCLVFNDFCSLNCIRTANFILICLMKLKSLFCHKDFSTAVTKNFRLNSSFAMNSLMIPKILLRYLLLAATITNSTIWFLNSCSHWRTLFSVVWAFKTTQELFAVVALLIFKIPNSGLFCVFKMVSISNQWWLNTSWFLPRRFCVTNIVSIKLHIWS